MLQCDRRIGMVFKRTDAPTCTASMRTAMNDLKLDRLLVVYPGSRAHGLASNIEVIPAEDVASFVQ